MDVTDYSKKLNSERQGFYDKIQQNSKSQAEELANVRETAAKRIEKQSKNFIEDKGEIETSYKDRFEQMNKTQKADLEAKNESYKSALKNNQSEFHELRSNSLKDFNDKLSSLKEDYSNNLSTEKKQHSKLQDATRSNYDERVDDILDKKEVTVHEFKENADAKAKELYSKVKKDKRDLVVKQEKDMQTLQADELEKRNFLKDKAVTEVDRIRQTREQERLTNNKKIADNFDRLTKSSAEKIANSEEQTSVAMDGMRNSQKEELKTQSASFRDKFADQQKSYDKDLRRLELDNKLNGIGSGSRNALFQEDKDKLSALNTEKRVDRILNERKNLEQTYAQKFEDATDEFKNTYRAKNIDKANAVEDLKSEKSKALASLRADYEIKLEQASKSQEKEIASSQNNAEEELTKVQLEKRNEVKRLKETFSKSVENNVKKSQSDFETARAEMDEEKSEIAERLKVDSNALLKSLRKDNIDKLAKVTEAYETKISSLENQNKTLSNKIKNVSTLEKEVLADKFKQREEIIKKQAKTSIIAERNNYEAKELKLRSNMAELQKNYDLKMTSLQNKNDSEIKRMNYEITKELDAQKQRLTNQIDQNQLNYEREFARIEAASQSEKSNLITQYEERIKKMEEINKNKIAELQQFRDIQKA